MKTLLRPLSTHFQQAPKAQGHQAGNRRTAAAFNDSRKCWIVNAKTGESWGIPGYFLSNLAEDVSALGLPSFFDPESFAAESFESESFPESAFAPESEPEAGRAEDFLA